MTYLIARDGTCWLVIMKQSDSWVVRGRFADRSDALDQLERLKGESCPTT